MAHRLMLTLRALCVALAVAHVQGALTSVAGTVAPGGYIATSTESSVTFDTKSGSYMGFREIAIWTLTADNPSDRVQFTFTSVDTAVFTETFIRVIDMSSSPVLLANMIDANALPTFTSSADTLWIIGSSPCSNNWRVRFNATYKSVASTVPASPAGTVITGSNDPPRTYNISVVNLPPREQTAVSLPRLYDPFYLRMWNIKQQLSSAGCTVAAGLTISVFAVNTEDSGPTFFCDTVFFFEIKPASRPGPAAVTLLAANGSASATPFSLTIAPGAEMLVVFTSEGASRGPDAALPGLNATVSAPVDVCPTPSPSSSPTPSPSPSPSPSAPPTPSPSPSPSSGSGLSPSPSPPIAPPPPVSASNSPSPTPPIASAHAPDPTPIVTSTPSPLPSTPPAAAVIPALPVFSSPSAVVVIKGISLNISKFQEVKDATGAILFYKLDLKLEGISALGSAPETGSVEDITVPMSNNFFQPDQQVVVYISDAAGNRAQATEVSVKQAGSGVVLRFKAPKMRASRRQVLARHLLFSINTPYDVRIEAAPGQPPFVPLVLANAFQWNPVGASYVLPYLPYLSAATPAAPFSSTVAALCALIVCAVAALLAHRNT